MPAGRGGKKATKPPVRQARKPERSKLPMKPLAPNATPDQIRRHLATEAMFKAQVPATYSPYSIEILKPAPPQGAPRDGRDVLGNASSFDNSADGSDGLVLGSHLRRQTNVGGDKGTPKPVDRSEVNKKAWLTRRKLYGSSGRKED